MQKTQLYHMLLNINRCLTSHLHFPNEIHAFSGFCLKLSRIDLCYCTNLVHKTYSINSSKDFISHSNIHCNSHIMVYFYDIQGMNEKKTSIIIAKKISERAFQNAFIRQQSFCWGFKNWSFINRVASNILSPKSRFSRSIFAHFPGF